MRAQRTRAETLRSTPVTRRLSKPRGRETRFLGPRVEVERLRDGSARGRAVARLFMAHGFGEMPRRVARPRRGRARSARGLVASFFPRFYARVYARFFARGLADVRVFSAGTSAWDGSPASDGALLVSLENGLALDETVERSLRGAALWDEVKDRLHESALGLSGGQMQRVAIARSLINNPSIILADEPTGNLDTKSADGVFDLLREMNRTNRTTFLIVTHDPRLAQRCDRIIEVVDGRIVADAPVPAPLRIASP